MFTVWNLKYIIKYVTITQSHYAILRNIVVHILKFATAL